MDFGNKIMKLRKKNGLSQEELAEKIGVARQTISKWELGETAPDLKQAKELSKIFNISLDELTNNDIKDVLIEKVSNTEKNTNKSLLVLKILVIFIVGIILLFLFLIAAKIISKNLIDKGRKIEENIHCKIYGEEHSYGIVYYELTAEPIESGGDAYFDYILDISKYNDAHQIFTIIRDYAKKNGGSCYMVENKDLNDIVDITIKEGTLTKKNATVVIKEEVDYDISYGESFRIEKYDSRSNSFDILENTTGNNCAFNMIAYSVDKDHPLELNQDWSCNYGELEKGHYRLVKEVSFDSDIPIEEDDNYYIWVEFEIE